MREILFRGKSRATKEWVYGNLIIDHYDVAGKTDDDYKIMDILYGYDMDGIPDFQSGVSEYVDPSTVGQYTGLTDKNGKKIFEGDILKLTFKNSPVIEWTAAVKFGNPNCTYSWGWQLDRISGDDPNPDILLWVEMEDAGALCEVIGNVHDKPELSEA